MPKKNEQNRKCLSEKCHKLAKRLPTTGSWFYQPLILPYGLSIKRGYDRTGIIKHLFGEKPFDSLIDLGCNVGHICYLARQSGAKDVVGVESVSRIFEVASLSGQVWGFKTYQGLAEDFVFNRNFDIITLFNLLHHRLSNRDPVTEIKKFAFRASRRLVIEVPVTEKKGIVVPSGRGDGSYWKWLFNAQDLKRFLLSLGFSKVHVLTTFKKSYGKIPRLIFVSIRDEKN